MLENDRIVEWIFVLPSEDCGSAVMSGRPHLFSQFVLYSSSLYALACIHHCSSRTLDLSRLTLGKRLVVSRCVLYINLTRVPCSAILGGIEQCEVEAIEEVMSQSLRLRMTASKATNAAALAGKALRKHGRNPLQNALYPPS